MYRTKSYQIKYFYPHRYLVSKKHLKNYKHEKKIDENN